MKSLSCRFAQRTCGGPRRSVLRCRNGAWLLVGWVGAALLPAPRASAQRIDEVTNPVILQAIDAYDSGDLERALDLLESAPTSLPAVEGAVRALYTGLIHFARGDATRARVAFTLAVRLDATAVLDPDVHAPSRIRAFEAARDAVVAEWRVQAEEAIAAGDTTEALQLWRSVLRAVPGDPASRSRVDEVEEAQRQAEAARQAREAAAAAAEDSVMRRFLPPPDTAPTRTDPADPDSAVTSFRTQVYNPGQALVLGMVVPGLGQMYADRRGLGFLSLAAAGGAAAAGVLVERVSIDCQIQPVNGTCPPGNILDERSERPYLVAGVAGAAAITLIGALDGFFAARRANERAAMTQAQESESGIAFGPALHMRRRTLQVEWARIRF